MFMCFIWQFAFSLVPSLTPRKTLCHPVRRAGLHNPPLNLVRGTGLHKPCENLVRSLVRSLLRSLLAANSRAPQDLVCEPCAQAFLAQPAPHNYTGLCASHCATIRGVCATRFRAAQLLHNYSFV